MSDNPSNSKILEQVGDLKGDVGEIRGTLFEKGKQIDNIENSFGEISRDISHIKATLMVNTQSLQEHMRRTAQNEEMISILKKDHVFAEKTNESRFKPIEDHIVANKATISTVVKISGFLITGVAGAWGAYHFFISLIGYLK